MTVSDSQDTSTLRALELPAPQHVSDDRDDVDELAETGEFPPLDVAAAAGRDTASPPTAADERASFWLKHLEGEIARLQSKWEFVATELRGREERIQQLLVEAQAKDALVVTLRKEIADRTANAEGLQADVASASQRIADLAAAQTERDAATARLEHDLAASVAHAAAQRDELAMLTAKLAELETGADADREDAERARKQRSIELVATNDLRVRIQELEAYIDGRSRSWTTLNEQLAQHREALSTTEKTVTTLRADLAAASTERERLVAKVADLEQRAAELTKRGDTLEIARTDLEKITAGQLVALAAIRAELADERRAKDQHAAELERRAESIASLKVAIAGHDRTRGDFEQTLESGRAERTKLEADNAAHVARVTALEGKVAARDEQVAALQAAVAAANAVASQAERKVADFENRMHATALEMADLQDGISARDQLVERFKSDLRTKQEALDLLERNVHRLDSLGASLEGLDRKLSASAIVAAPVQPVAAGAAHSAVTRPRAVAAEALPAAGAAVEAPIVATTPGRKLVIALDGQVRRTYPLDSGWLTVGRSNDCDIRIHSPFVSRMHARIFVRGAATLIEDLGSKNGILVNAKAIDGPAPLHDGDIISLGGQLELKYVDLEHRTDSVARH
jgi:uncharacterized coiled-coil protein SlyX